MIRVIPAIDIIDGKCVRLTRGDYSRQTTYDASPVDMVKRMVDSGLPHIHAVDLTGARLGRPSALGLLEKMAAVDGAVIEWGGGIKTDADMRDLFNAGATRGVIGSVAVRDPELFASWLGQYGGDSVVLGADLNDGKVAVDGWTASGEVSAAELVERFLPEGLQEMIVTDISRDGMLAGPSFDLYAELMERFGQLKVIASGGVSGIADIERLARMGVPAVIVGKALYEGRVTLRQLYDVSIC
ncbi:MAG: 1-(5-phosphoribosyl)-5-[(5-phosphoribosylamino)methylideneamino]imidazole-4-carboxamide isomerase [Muribaculaceae bacterium]|nr:1-(5-phosphoribosyl)-5-[(5-phosphoribosylamino)methylideneamino]imidazole-4-carboxamide isomerase [Muribaculaceae bacterium]